MRSKAGLSRALKCPNTLALVACLLLPSLVRAQSVDRIIDDEWGDPVTGLKPIYSVNWDYGPTCPTSFCFVRPDQNKTFNGTWHHTMSTAPSTAGHQVSMSFVGTAISVYAVLANPPSESGSVLFTNVTFELDGNLVGTYSHIPDPSAEQFEYNITIFSTSGLNNMNHTLTMTDAQGAQMSLLLFDYAKYTFEDESASVAGAKGTSVATSTAMVATNTSRTSSDSQNLTPKPPPAVAIACGVVGGVAFITGCLILLRYIKKQRATPYAKEENARMVDPFVASRPGDRNQANTLRNVKPEDLLMARWATYRSSIEEAPAETNTTAEHPARSVIISGAPATVACSSQNDVQPPVVAAQDTDPETHLRMTRKLMKMRAEMARWKATRTRRMRQGDPPHGPGPV